MISTLEDMWSDLMDSPAFTSTNGVLTISAAVFAAASGGSIAGEGSWWVSGILIAVVLVLVFIVAARLQRTTPELVSVLMDPKFFMPYCICPECKLEGLHWMKSTAIPRDRESLLKYYREVEAHNATSPFALNFWLRLDDDYRLPMAEQWAKEREAKSDVIRECRDCGHTWGQKVGLGALS